MQAAQLLSPSSTYDSCSASGCSEVAAKLSELLTRKLDFNGGLSNGVLEDNDVVEKGGRVDELREEEDENANGGEGESDGDDDFSFACLNPDASSISADDIFQDGQIRPVYPLFNRDLLLSDATDGNSAAEDVLSLGPSIKKVFVKERKRLSPSESDELAGVAAETYCEWSRKVEETSPELCKKSNSTGFSKLWRFRELVHHRSSSDGKDAFVFLNSPSSSAAGRSSKEKVEKVGETSEKKERPGGESRSGGGKIKANKKEVVGGKTTSSVHDRPYAGARRRMDQKEGVKRKSYLPYRQDLVGMGFFTSVNGLSRNVHPF